MATEKPWSVAFVGAGASTEENVKHVLDDWMHAKREYNPPIIPAGIKKQHKGLMEVWSWLDTEFGKQNYDQAEAEEIVARLTKAREKAEVFLVYIPDGEAAKDSYFEIVKDALFYEIPVLDLTAGLYPFELPAEDKADEPEEEPEQPKARRGRPRTTKQEEIEESMSREDPPWNDGSETASDAPKPSDAPTRSETSQVTVVNNVAPPSAAIEGGVTVTLSQQTIDLLLATFTSLSQDVATAIQATLPGPKPKTYPFWVDEDGNYRPREKGRGRKGETAVDLTSAQIEELGL